MTCKLKQSKIINGQMEEVCSVQICMCEYKGERLEYDKKYNRTYALCMEGE